MFQKKLLAKYAKDHHYNSTKFYVDDGYTGTNFNRPGFQKLLEDIEAGYVTTLIVKDMSRLGRNYLQAGYYTDTYFLDHNVNFIAINDGVDSEQGDDDFSPFRNIMNEWYAKDISRKVRSSKKLRGKAGDPLCLPPYGYNKNADNPKQWDIDPETAEVVRMIYRLCIEGNGIETTARILQESGILTPTQYWAAKGIRKGGKKTQDTPCKWCKTTITKILTLREYTGDLINFKTYSKSFKNKRRLPNAEENKVLFENHHAPLIDRTTWETVQKIREGTKRRAPKNSEKNMFAGLLYCADCGSKLHYNINHPNNAIEYFNCSNYRGNRGTCIETHYIRADSLEQVVLLELNRMTCYLKENEEAFAELLAQKTSQDYELEQKQRGQKLRELTARNAEVDVLFERIYEDNVSGKNSDDRFMKMSQKYDEEQKLLKKEIAELQAVCDREDSRAYSKNQFLKAVRKFMEMKTLTPTILHELVEKIDVYHIQGTGKNRTQQITIHYKFIGVLELPKVRALQDNVTLNSRQGVEIEYLAQKAG
ncbi:MAG TPA: recombinase family protein [Clostridiales bacterium]|nr:recombinase family protein [Clostridiales bacterium]